MLLFPERLVPSLWRIILNRLLSLYSLDSSILSRAFALNRIQIRLALPCYQIRFYGSYSIDVILLILIRTIMRPVDSKVWDTQISLWLSINILIMLHFYYIPLVLGTLCHFSLFTVTSTLAWWFSLPSRKFDIWRHESGKDVLFEVALEITWYICLIYLIYLWLVRVIAFKVF